MENIIFFSTLKIWMRSMLTIIDIFFILLSKFVFELKFIYLFVFRIEIRFYPSLFEYVQSRLCIRASSISKYIKSWKEKKREKR